MTKVVNKPHLKLSIQVLKGIHSFEAIPELIEKTQSSDIILIEAVGLAENNKNVQDVIHLLLNDNDFVDSLEADTEEKAKYIVGFHAEIAWGFRRQSDKYIALVDKYDCIDNQELATFTYGEKFDCIDDHEDELITNRYSMFNKVLVEELDVIKHRDKLVAKQTQTIIHQLTEQGRFNENDEIKVSLIVGAIHKTAEHLREHFPKTEIIEHFYAKPAFDQFISTPVGRLAIEMINNDGKVDPKVVDYFIFNTYLNATQVDYSEKVIEVINKGGIDSLISSLLTTGVQSIDDYSTVELRQLADTVIEAD